VDLLLLQGFHQLIGFIQILAFQILFAEMFPGQEGKILTLIDLPAGGKAGKQLKIDRIGNSAGLL
jgi:hypothetical protein